MRLRNTFTSVLVIVGTATAIALILAGWQTRKVQAIQDSEDRPNPFGFIELGAGQTARLSVINFLSSPPPDGDSPPTTSIARRVRLGFDVYIQDPDYTPSCGGIVPVPPTCLLRYRFLRRESSEVDLMQGQAASLDFTTFEGAKVQAFVQKIANPALGGPDTTPEPHLIPSLEVRESTRTLFVVPALVKFFNPQPDPPGQLP